MNKYRVELSNGTFRIVMADGWEYNKNLNMFKFGIIGGVWTAVFNRDQVLAIYQDWLGIIPKIISGRI